MSTYITDDLNWIKGHVKGNVNSYPSTTLYYLDYYHEMSSPDVDFLCECITTCADCIGFKDNVDLKRRLLNLRMFSKFRSYDIEPEIEKVKLNNARIELEKHQKRQREMYYEELMAERNKMQREGLKRYQGIVEKLWEECTEEFNDKFECMIPTCPISLEPIINHCILPCGHLFERDNIIKVDPSKCPLCRQWFNKTHIRHSR